jgi:hypothetical protein
MGGYRWSKRRVLDVLDTMWTVSAQDCMKKMCWSQAKLRKAYNKDDVSES